MDFFKFFIGGVVGAATATVNDDDGSGSGEKTLPRADPVPNFEKVTAAGEAAGGGLVAPTPRRLPTPPPPPPPKVVSKGAGAGGDRVVAGNGIVEEDVEEVEVEEVDDACGDSGMAMRRFLGCGGEDDCCCCCCCRSNCPATGSSSVDP